MSGQEYVYQQRSIVSWDSARLPASTIACHEAAGAYTGQTCRPSRRPDVMEHILKVNAGNFQSRSRTSSTGDQPQDGEGARP